MLTYSTLHARDRVLKKKYDDKPCSLEGLNTLEKYFI